MPKYIKIDKRATGQGKTYDVLEYLLNTEDKCLYISSNISNIDDFYKDSCSFFNKLEPNNSKFIQFIQFLDNKKENIDNTIEILITDIIECKEKLENLLSQDLKLQDYSKYSIQELKKDLQENIDKNNEKISKLSSESNQIERYLKDTTLEINYIEKLKNKFIRLIIPTINSFFAVEKVMEVKVGSIDKDTLRLEMVKIPPNIACFYGGYNFINELNQYELTDNEKKIQALQGDNIEQYDTILIDEVDKTLGNITLKSNPLVVSYMSVDWEALQEDYRNNEDFYTRRKYPTFKVEHQGIDITLPTNIFSLEYVREYIKNILDERGIEYKIHIDETVEYFSYKTQELNDLWVVKSDLDVESLQEGGRKYLFIESIKLSKFFNKHLKEEGSIVLLGATHNKIVDSFINNNLFENKGWWEYSKAPYIKPIKYNVIKKEPEDRNIKKDVFIIVKNKAIQYELKYKNKGIEFYYFTQGILRGSNSLGNRSGCFFNFSLNSVNHAPCNNLLSYFSKIGNQFYVTKEDIIKHKNDYRCFHGEFNKYKHNTIVQTLGRLNRGISEKYIYYIDDIVGSIIKKTIREKLKQKVMEND